MSTFKEFSWSKVVFKPGRPLLDTELNLASDLSEYKRKSILEYQASSGFLRKKQFENVLSDYDLNTPTSPKLNPSVFLYEGEIYNAPEIDLSFAASVGDGKKVLAYLELSSVDVDTAGSPGSYSDPNIPKFGYSNSTTTISSEVFKSNVGMPTAARKQLVFTLKFDTDYGTEYLESNPAGLTPNTKWIPLCLIFRRTSETFTLTNTTLNVVGVTNHPEGLKLNDVYPLDILDLRPHVYLPHFSLSSELERQMGLLLNNELKTWAISTHNMDIPAGVTVQSEISTTPLVIGTITEPIYGNKYSYRPFTFTLTSSGISALATPVSDLYRDINNNIIYKKSVYNLDTISPGSTVVDYSVPGYIKVTLASGGSAVFSCLHDSEFSRYNYNNKIIKKDLTIINKTNNSYDLGTSSVGLVAYRTAAPQSLGSGISNFELNLKVIPVYAPDHLYITSVGSYSRTVSSEYLAPSEQIPMDNTIQESTFLTGSGNLIGSSFAVEEGFVQLPLIKKSGIQQKFTFERTTGSSPGGTLGAKDSSSRSTFSMTIESLTSSALSSLIVQAEGLMIPANRKIFYPMLVRVESSSKPLVSQGDLLLVVLSKAVLADKSKLTNELDTSQNDVLASIFKPQGLWKII